MTLRTRVVATYHNLFNPKFAIVSAICNGLIVAWINRPYGPEKYIPAALWQGVLSFLATGVTARVVQHFSPLKSRFRSYFFGSLIPASMTFLAAYAVHSWNHTPRLLASCASPTLISYATSYLTNWLTRRGHLLPGNYKK